MKDIIVYTIWLLCSFALMAISAAMATKGIAGWGWFFLAGFISILRFSYKGNDRGKSDKQKEVTNG